MRLQFATVLKDRHGEDFTETDPKDKTKERPVTLGEVCVSVLDMVFQDESSEGLKPKLRRAELVDKITAAEKSATPLELLEADVDMIKERIGKRNFPPSLTAAAARLLDAPKSEQKSDV